MADQERTEKEQLDSLLTRLEDDDSFVLIEDIFRQHEPLAAVNLINDLVRHLHWERKAVDLLLFLARAGIQHGLLKATELETSDAEMAYELRSTAKAIAYNLASFTWPGWGEEGVTVSGTSLRLGLDAALTNLRLARSLDKGPLPLSRACWIVGAQHLAAGDLPAAKENFSQAATWARKANEEAEALLSDGYLQLAIFLDSPDDAPAQANLDQIKTALVDMEHGQFFIEQLETAFRVFST